MDRYLAEQLLQEVINGDEQALWGCVRLALRSNDLGLLVKATNYWRGVSLFNELKIAHDDLIERKDKK